MALNNCSKDLRFRLAHKAAKFRSVRDTDDLYSQIGSECRDIDL